MAKPTERALKRKPKAVILLTTLRKDVPDVPTTQGGREFEWFDTDEGMRAFFDQNDAFHQEDAKGYDDMAFMTVEITDTATMKIGRIAVAPDTEATKDWLKSIEADVTKAFSPVTAVTGEGKKVVRPRAKSKAAAAVQPVKGDVPKTKAAQLKARLAEKKAEDKKSETGDPAPKPVVKDHPVGEAPKEIPNPPKPRARRTTVKKQVSAANESEFVVKKAAVESKSDA